MSEQQLVTILSDEQYQLIKGLFNDSALTALQLPMVSRKIRLEDFGQLLQHRVFFNHENYGVLQHVQFFVEERNRRLPVEASLIAAGKHGWVAVGHSGIVTVSDSYRIVKEKFPDLFTRFYSTIAKLALSGCALSSVLNTLDAAFDLTGDEVGFINRLMGEWHETVVRAVDVMVLISNGQFPCWYEDELGVLSNWESPEVQKQHVINAFSRAGISYEASIEAAGDPQNGWKYFMETLDTLFGLSDEVLLENQEVVTTLFDILVNAIEAGAAPAFVDASQMQKHLTMMEDLNLVSSAEDHLTQVRNIFKHYQALGDFDAPRG